MKSLRKNSLIRRLSSLFLALAMVISLIPAGIGSTEVQAEEAQSKKLTVHFKNADGWNEVYGYAWNDMTYWLGGWPGTQLNENAEHAGWYDMVLTGLTQDKVEFIFNNNSGSQTANLSNEVNTAAEELWYINGAVTDQVSWDTAVEETPTRDLTVHYKNTKNWEKVYGYVWNASGSPILGSWPGVELNENEEHTGWYDLILTGIKDNDVNFIFNNNNNDQTADLSNKVDTAAAELWCIGESVTTEESWNATEEKPEESETPGESSGSASLKVGDLIQVKNGDALLTMDLYLNGVYEAAAPEGEVDAVLYVNGKKTDAAVTGTVESGSKKVFRVENGELKLVAVDTAAFTGNFAGLDFVDDNGSSYTIASWTPADTNAELEYLGGGIYKRTFKFNALETDLEIADGGYKVAMNDSWDRSYGEGSGNKALTVSAGSTSLTVVLDSITGTLSDSVNGGTFKTSQNDGENTWPVWDTTISLIGDIRGTGDNDWNNTAAGYEFEQISSTLFRYQMDLEAGTYNYKCVFQSGDSNKWYEKEAGNRTITLTEAAHVVIVYDTETGFLYDTVNNASKVGQLLGMEAAPAEMKVVNNADGTTCFIALAEAGSAVTLYYGNKADVEANGASALKTAATTAVNGGGYQTENIFLGDDALDIVYYYDINGTRTLDNSNEIVSVGGADYSNYKRDAFTGRLVCVPGTFPGNSWDAASNVMTYIGNGRYEYVFKNVPAANYEYKIAMGSWSENYGVNGAPDGANISVAVTKQQDVTIWYDDFSHRSVCSVNYAVADIYLSGTGIPEGTKLTDDELKGIYSVTLELQAGTYDDLKLTYGDKVWNIAAFTLEETKEVTFYCDPVIGIYYHNASNEKIDTDSIYFDSKDETYKDVFGAAATDEEVTFTIDTGADVAGVQLVFKGADSQALSMEEVEIEEKDATETAGKRFRVTTSFKSIGEYKYYFVLMGTGGNVVVYTDDDGYYGTGTATSLDGIENYYELVVYEAGFETPDWMKNAVIYQIFPDRFYDGDESNNDNATDARGAVDYEYITDWYTIPENPEQEGLLDEETYKSYGAYYGDGEWSNEIYGGDLEGIVEKIDYLKALGVNVIYLNPVFASISNHRYDTSDYMEIDPILGTEGDFAELVEVAEANDMKIILDGVFNHVSDDSIYFDRYYNYLGTSEKVGAYPYWAYVYDLMAEENIGQDAAEAKAKAYFEEAYGITDFSYTEWFDVKNTPMTGSDGETVKDTIGLRAGEAVYTYDGWWGYDSMPIIKSTNGSEYQTGNWADEIIHDEDGNGSSVTEYWISKGNNGWRLDVANEVSDETWQQFRDSVKALDSDAVIVGEIWDDATKYLMGDMYDSVMNYVFRNNVTAFAKGEADAEQTTKAMEKIRERYPEEAFYAMMNLVGSHDTTRILSYLDGIGDDRNQKDAESAFPTFEGTSDAAKARQKLVAFLQFTYAGAPTIYYGDEIGMVGADDPDDRRAFTWGKGDEETVLWYAKMAEIRSQYSALRTGSVEAFTFEEEDATSDANLMGYVRRDDANALIVIANNASENKEVTFSTEELGVEGTSFTDLITGTVYEADEDGYITVDVTAVNGVILVETEAAVEITVDETALACAYDEAYVIAERSATPPADEAEDTDDGKDDADDSKEDADEGKDNAGDSKEDADEGKDNAGDSKDDADEGKDNAGDSKDDADEGKNNTGSDKDNNKNNGTQSGGKTPVDTGDTGNGMTVLILVMIVAAAGIVVILKKRQQK